MVRKRKIAVNPKEKENEYEENLEISSRAMHGPIFTIMSNVQRSETLHKRYIKEMKELYEQMDHDAFLYTFIKMIKVAMQADESNEYAHTTLIFCAKFVSSFDAEDTHALLVDTCKWLLTTISYNPHIRLRLCQFVNMILNALGQEAALDDGICDRIMEYMLAQLRDVAPSVRVQAILAMQRLQVPDNPDDPVVRAYQFHLCSDPSPRVRQTVITCIGRNHNTIPYVLERLWDIDEKVRRHTYLHMSSYPVRSYKVRQRLMLIEQGLNDRADIVRKVVINILLQQWLESYERNFISLTAALKLDASESELDRFRKAGKQMLSEIFKRQAKEELLACLPFVEEDEQFPRCVPFDKLNIEVAFYWQCLVAYLQKEMAEEIDKILPELSTYCVYVEKFCQDHNGIIDQFEFMEYQFILLSLLEIAHNYDLGDEIGRTNLQKLLTCLLKNYRLNQRVIQVIAKCLENLMPDQNLRLQYLADVIRDVCVHHAKHNPLVHDRSLINELLADSTDTALNLKLTSLKVKILDLEEQETNCWQRKTYEQANKYTEEKNQVIDEYTKLLQPILDKHSLASSLSIISKEVKNEIVIKGLQIIFYMIVSEKVNTLNPSASKLYNDFICRHIASNNISARDWALKCGTAYSMLYEANAKEVFEELYIQFFKNHNPRLWETSINCIFDLLDRYGIEKFAIAEKQKTKKAAGGGRQLYNTMEQLDVEEDTNNELCQGVDVMYLMSHFLNTCHDVCIVKSIVNGFCRLVLRGHIQKNDILEKLLLRYFHPNTDSEINQTLGVFFETLMSQRKHHLLEGCLLSTVNAIFSASYDSPLRDIRPEHIMRFIIDSTLPGGCSNSTAIHNRLAKCFLNEMLSNVSNKELCKLLSKELVNLLPNISTQPALKEEFKQMIEKLRESELEQRTAKQLLEFRDKLDGIVSARLTTQTSVNAESNDEDEEDIISTDVGIECDAVSNKTTTTSLCSSVSAALDIPPLPPLPVLEHGISPPGKRPSNTPLNVSTTYGRDNNVQHHSLRKSLNSSLNNQTQEISPPEGPTRPAKIRIEARIDSDSTPSTPQPQAQTTPQRRNNGKATDSETTPLREDNACDKQQDKRHAQTEKITRRRPGRPRSVVSKNLKRTVSLTRTPNETPRNKSQASTAEDVSVQSLSRSARKQHNNSEIIPPSPTAATPAPRLINSTIARSLRSGVKNGTTSAATRHAIRTSKAQSKDAEQQKQVEKPQSQARGNHSSSAGEMLRRPKVRVLRLTSKCLQQTKKQNTTPITKRTRTTPLSNTPKTVNQTLLHNKSSATPRRSVVSSKTPVRGRRLERSMNRGKRAGTPSVDKLRAADKSSDAAKRACLTPEHNKAEQLTKIPRATRNLRAAKSNLSSDKNLASNSPALRLGRIPKAGRHATRLPIKVNKKKL